MKFTTFMKHWCLLAMAATIGGTIGSAIRKDWPLAIFSMICCAINHLCYNCYKKRDGKV